MWRKSGPKNKLKEISSWTGCLVQTILTKKRRSAWFYALYCSLIHAVKVNIWYAYFMFLYFAQGKRQQIRKPNQRSNHKGVGSLSLNYVHSQFTFKAAWH